MDDVDNGREDGRNEARGSEGLAGPGAVDERGDRRHGDEGLHFSLQPLYAPGEKTIICGFPSKRPFENYVKEKEIRRRKDKKRDKRSSPVPGS